MSLRFSLQTLFERRVERILTPLESFIRKQAAAGLLLAFAAILGLFLANSPLNNWIIFLAVLATLDDIITILIIVVFYIHELHLDPLLKALIPLALLHITPAQPGARA